MTYANIGVVYFESVPSLELVSPQQVFSISMCGVFYFPCHRHQIEGTNGVYCLFERTERNCPSFETAEVVLNPGPLAPTSVALPLDHRATGESSLMQHRYFTAFVLW